MEKIKRFIAGEFTGWHIWEVLWLIFCCISVIVLSQIMGDNIIGIISALTGVLYTVIAGKGKTALCFGDGQMYASTPFTGGYTSSKMKTTILTNIDSQLNAIFSTHLKSTWELLSSANNSTAWAKYGSAAGASTGWGWQQVKSVLLSEIEAYGSVSFGSTGFDIGSAMTQLPLFRHWPEALWDRDTQTSWWLKDVVTGSMFATVYWAGDSHANTATHVIGVRPRFLIS